MTLHLVYDLTLTEDVIAFGLIVGVALVLMWLAGKK